MLEVIEVHRSIDLLLFRIISLWSWRPFGLALLVALIENLGRFTALLSLNHTVDDLLPDKINGISLNYAVLYSSKH
jgi:hypothetical protein